MNKQSLTTLTLQQLRQHKQILAKRIDDLKFFNLDLGRENIRLAEQYKVARQQAEKVKQGKAPRLRRAKNFTKNIYLQRQPQYSHIQRVQKPKNQQKNLGGGGLKLNDFYKVGKSKLTGWWGSSGNEKKVTNDNVNQQINNYYSPGVNNGQYYEQGYSSKVEHLVVIDCPPAEVMKQPEVIQKDPILQQVTYIVRQNNFLNQPQQNSVHQSRNYERLYHQQDNQRYLRQVQRQQQQMKMNVSVTKDQQNQQKRYHYDQANTVNLQQKKQQKKQYPNRKNFEFDDLPGMGWRKLKGWVGFGSKSKADNKNKVQQSSNINQQSYQQQQKMTRSYNPSISNNQHYNQHTRQTYISQHNQQKQSQNHQRKRIPIFGSEYNPGMKENKREQVSQQYHHKGFKKQQYQIVKDKIYQNQEKLSQKQHVNEKIDDEQRKDQTQHQPTTITLAQKQNQSYHHKQQQTVENNEGL